MNNEMTEQTIKAIVVDALEELKGVDIQCLDVSQLTDITDTMVLASGTSNRHLRSLANNVIVNAKAEGHRPLGTDGQNSNDWVLVDFGDVVVHVMSPESRAFYDLESLWSEIPEHRNQDDKAE
jgi:ribosome-associated protein